MKICGCGWSQRRKRMAHMCSFKVTMVVHSVMLYFSEEKKNGLPIKWYVIYEVVLRWLRAAFDVLPNAIYCAMCNVHTQYDFFLFYFSSRSVQPNKFQSEVTFEECQESQIPNDAKNKLLDSVFFLNFILFCHRLQFQWHVKLFLCAYTAHSTFHNIKIFIFSLSPSLFIPFLASWRFVIANKALHGLEMLSTSRMQY